MVVRKTNAPLVLGHVTVLQSAKMDFIMTMVIVLSVMMLIAKLAIQLLVVHVMMDIILAV